MLAPQLRSSAEWLNENLGGFFLFATGNASVAGGGTIFTGGIVLAVMILPIITSQSREVFLQTPVLHQEAALSPARLGELQQGVLLSQPALSRLVDRLEARGLVARSSDQTDGRAVRVTLTPAGRELQQTVGRSHARSVERELRALTPDEQRELKRLVTKLLAPAKLSHEDEE